MGYHMQTLGGTTVPALLWEQRRVWHDRPQHDSDRKHNWNTMALTLPGMFQHQISAWLTSLLSDLCSKSLHRRESFLDQVNPNTFHTHIHCPITPHPVLFSSIMLMNVWYIFVYMCINFSFNRM